MKVSDNGNGAYSVDGLTACELEMLGALAAFPLWSAQPEHVRAFCAALHKEVNEAAPLGSVYLHCYSVGMVPQVSTLGEP
ncbi:hypothetical protein SMC26_39530 [Actinomadura fulvescens]|uniref:Uncharacterized protein n=1 Tax=Actinomadura fulvescens TaxID=46160 RepID=A0ABP6C9X2_9ACTN